MGTRTPISQSGDRLGHHDPMFDSWIPGGLELSL